MKKIAFAVILFLFAVLAWKVVSGGAEVAFMLDGEYVDGPLAALAALLFAGGGVVVGVVAILFAGLVLAVVFAGLGILVAAALALAVLAATAALSPVLLPLLLPLAAIWFLVERSRRDRMAVK